MLCRYMNKRIQISFKIVQIKIKHIGDVFIQREGIEATKDVCLCINKSISRVHTSNSKCYMFMYTHNI